MVQTLDGIFIDNVLFQATNRPSELEKHEVIDFLMQHLSAEEANEVHIRKAIEYSTKERLSFGGFTLVQRIDRQIVGVAIVNHTGMEGYLPENIVVYLAFNKKIASEVIQENLLNYLLRHAKGEIMIKNLANQNHIHKGKTKLGFTQLR